MSTAPLGITPIGDGVYRVDDNGRSRVVYVACTDREWWAYCDGQLFRGPRHDTAGRRARPAADGGSQALTSPMPATVRQVLVRPGDAVKKGDSLIVLEAMKMELPLRAGGDAVVKAVHCREGELVNPDTVLVELA